MIICIGPFCVPVWGLLPLLALLARNFWGRLKAFWSRLAGGPKSAAQEQSSDTSVPAEGAEPAASSVADEAQGSTLRKRLFTGVRNIESEDQWHAAQADATAQHVPLFVQFTAPFCKPCKRLAPVFDKHASSHPGIFARVDVEQLSDVALSEGVSVLPVFKVYRNGALAGSLVGDFEADLARLVDEHR